MRKIVISVSLPLMIAPAVAAPTDSSTSAPTAGATSSITYGGGDGLTCDQAIVIPGAKGKRDGVHFEYDWLKLQYPGYKMKRQAEINGVGKEFDQLDFFGGDQKPHSVCFDITAFYRKF